MIVDPDFLTHWKTRTLVRLLEDEAAPLYVIALWAHCQSRKTDRLQKVDSFEFASICGYPFTEADKFLEAMQTCRFIEVGAGEIIVHDFAKTNAKLFSNWKNGSLGGRPAKTDSKPTRNPHKTQSEIGVSQSKPVLSNLSNQSTLKDPSLGKSENPFLLQRVRKLFHKRTETPMDASEVKAWKVAVKSVEATSDEDWTLIEWVYGQSEGSACQYRRKDMATLLNNWNCEIDRARGWKNGNGVKAQSQPDDWKSKTKILN